uniref:Uncharacterized protein n=1 Tax=Myoviridae sp. ctLnO19 TaxID=2825085 RepID=A0A8S5P116_9CAUD|nr:MAG TPA: hypothetical protein [Myoviridae sp. ctLnO19]DAJ69121.1 MAG TPA: hypothetical protein [Caudoviricetes sp.]
MVIDRPKGLPSIEAIRNYRIAENEVLQQQISRMLLKSNTWLQDAVNYHRLSNR